MIEQSFIDEFRVYQKEHVLDLSREIIIGFGTMESVDCPNCTWDGDQSGAKYTGFAGSVTVFSGTPYERTFEAKPFRIKCTICGGKGVLSVPNEKTIKAHVRWGSVSNDTYPNSPAGWSGQGQVKLKANSSYYSDFLRAKYFMVNGVRVEPSSIPIIRGMKSPDGIVEILCKTVNTGKEITK